MSTKQPISQVLDFVGGSLKDLAEQRRGLIEQRRELQTAFASPPHLAAARTANILTDGAIATSMELIERAENYRRSLWSNSESPDRAEKLAKLDRRVDRLHRISARQWAKVASDPAYRRVMDMEANARQEAVSELGPVKDRLANTETLIDDLRDSHEALRKIAYARPDDPAIEVPAAVAERDLTKLTAEQTRELRTTTTDLLEMVQTMPRPVVAPMEMRSLS